MEGSSSGKRENPDQIPQEDDTLGKTGGIISEQAGVEGQRKQVNVESYSKVAALGQILKDMDFPADKNRIVEFARQQQQKKSGMDNKTLENNEDILSALQNIEEREYKNVSDVSTALGYVY
ncbi:MAG: DUF2795 domain-containing protein [Thermoproteota archaeon]|nr:DUF2795 domain-containing protein [Thermoproteota archaeon]